LSEVGIYASQQPLSTLVLEGLFTGVRGRIVLGSPHPESCIATVHELWAYGRQERLELATE
jgi:hypothetical protein